MRIPRYIATQMRRPYGVLGRAIIELSALQTVRENRVALEMLDLSIGDRLLEIGLGSGRALQSAARLAPLGHSAGLDISPTTIKAAKRRNRRDILAGNMTLEIGSSEAIPFPDESFDKVLGVHVAYFWNVATDHLKEIYRVMSPGGFLVLCYRPQTDVNFVNQIPQDIFVHRSSAQIEALCKETGFNQIRSHTQAHATRTIVWTYAGKPISGATENSQPRQAIQRAAEPGQAEEHQIHYQKGRLNHEE